MAIVTLTTDWGTKDHYLAAVKGSLLKAIPNLTIIDIAHDIPSFDVYQASFILKNSYKSFPANTIHIIGVKSESSIKTPHIAIRIDNQYFIGADNGIFSLVFDKQPDKVVEIEIMQESDKFTFSTKDVFVKTAQIISEGKFSTDLGFETTIKNKYVPFKPVIEPGENGSFTITGKVIYIDRYENAIINITETLFNEYCRGKNFKISFNSFSNSIEEISQSYYDVPTGEMMALFGSNGLLEIAVNEGNASSLLGLYNDTKIRIKIGGFD